MQSGTSLGAVTPLVHRGEGGEVRAFREGLGLKWSPALVGGVVYDLGHLHPLSFDFVVPAKDGKPEQVYPLDVTFSLHCFTRGIRSGETYAPDLAYSDSRETRLFDARRHRLSLLLPDIVRGIGARRCFHTAHGNFFTVEIVDDEGHAAGYTVYFTVSRSTRRGRLTLYVQSAYVQDGVPRQKPKPRKPIRFSVIAHNVTTARPVRAQK